MILDRQSYLATIRSRLADYPVVALPGPRQAVKTVLAQAELLCAEWV